MDQEVKVAFVALGCAKNLVDSEKMLGQLAEAGAVLTPDETQADVIVINTCGFLAASRTEAHEAIRQAVRQKKRGACRRVVVAGCLVQRDGQRLLDDVAGIDALVGVHERDDIVRAALDLPDLPRRAQRRPRNSRPQPDLYLGDYHPYIALDTARLRLTPRHYAYLRISEGCNQKCTFCTIPAIRGPMHCKPLEMIKAEARELIADGAVELNLIGQDTTSYGRDIGYGPGLAGMLRELNALDGARWIRLLYVYPTDFTDQMIDAIAECDRVVKYIDMPLQHINDRMLKAMHRRVTRAQTETLLRRIRDRIPGVAIRTTMIAGFPGESEAEFNELLEFVRDFGFSALGVFPYSREPDTPAGRMQNQLPDTVKQARADAIMAAQQEVAFRQAADRAGEFLEVLIESKVHPGRGASAPAGRRGRRSDAACYAARHAGQAPEVDSVTYVLADHLEPGRFVRVLVQGSQDYDLIARPTDVMLPVLAV